MSKTTFGFSNPPTWGRFLIVLVERFAGVCMKRPILAEDFYAASIQSMSTTLNFKARLFWPFYNITSFRVFYLGLKFDVGKQRKWIEPSL